MRNQMFEEEVCSGRERIWRLATTEVCTSLRGCVGFLMVLVLQWLLGFLYLYSVCCGFPDPPVDARPATNEATCLKAVTAALLKKQTNR